jgi:hypothetical protein
MNAAHYHNKGLHEMTLMIMKKVATEIKDRLVLDSFLESYLRNEL